MLAVFVLIKWKISGQVFYAVLFFRLAQLEKPVEIGVIFLVKQLFVILLLPNYHASRSHKPSQYAHCYHPVRFHPNTF